MNRRFLKATLVVSAVTLGLAIWPSHAASSGTCRPVNGHLEERQVPGPGFAATGRLTGGIQGTDTFTLLSLSPTDPSTPTVSHFVGKSVFQTKTGDIQLTVAGAFDTDTGKFSDLLTITGGTGEWTGASGQIHLFGVFDLQAGVGASDYRGEVCLP
jgi:hypothetical protein